MSLPRLAEIADFEVRYGTAIEAEDINRVEALLDDASALARDVAGDDFVDSEDALETVPGTIVAIVCESVRRAYDNPAGLEGETIGDYSWRGVRTTDSGVYFTRDEIRRVRRAAGRSGGYSVGMEADLPIPDWWTVTDADS